MVDASSMKDKRGATVFVTASIVSLIDAAGVQWAGGADNALALLRLYGTAQPELLTDRDLCTLLYEEKTSRLACLMLCCKKAFRVLLWREKQVKTQQVQVPDQQPWKGACVDFETKV